MMLYIHGLADPESPVTDVLALPYESRLKSRQRLVLTSGETVTCSLSPGTSLKHGDKLVLTGGPVPRVLVVEAAAEPLLEVRINDGLQFARVAYHLGNRHAKIEVGSDVLGTFLRLPLDHILEEMLCHLGCKPKYVNMPFQPEGGAYGAHGHFHHHTVDHDNQTGVTGARIHTFS